LRFCFSTLSYPQLFTRTTPEVPAATYKPITQPDR
jgi:hypothetical protein